MLLYENFVHFCKKLTSNSFAAENIADPDGKGPLYVCELCPFTSNKYKSWIDHVNYKHKEPRYSCEDCNKKFPKLSMLKNHRKVHEEKKCADCDEVFKSTRSYLTHRQTAHPTTGLYEELTCKPCNTRFTTSVGLDKHRRLKHAGENLDMYLCYVCSEQFKDIPSLNLHKDTHLDPSSEENRPHHCGECPKSFKEIKHLKEHMIIHTRTTKEEFKCDICGISYLRAHSLAKHRLIHTQPDYKPEHKCFVCQETFSSRKELVAHKETCKRPIGSTRICKVCNLTLPTRSKLIAHLNEVHNDDSLGNLKCTICDKTYHRMTQKDIHMKQYHEKTFSVYCDICGKGFVVQGMLNKHMVTHTECNHICDLCGKIFKSSKAYRLHIMVHNGETPYECEVCSKKFVKEYMLRIHMETHTLEKNYTCKICARSYGGPSYLYKHMHSIHGITKSGRAPVKRSTTRTMKPRPYRYRPNRSRGKKSGGPKTNKKNSSKNKKKKVEHVQEEEVEEEQISMFQSVLNEGSSNSEYHDTAPACLVVVGEDGKVEFIPGEGQESISSSTVITTTVNTCATQPLPEPSNFYNLHSL